MAVRYKILEELGAGGAGAVFKAYDTQLDRYVALKRLMSKEESERQESAATSLRKEAASLATLQHPNIVSVFDLGSDEEGFYMVMELVDGETLADWVKSTPMTLADFKELASQCLEAVMTAHTQSILHRDLKPENIKIKRLPGGRIQVKVLDFGLARMSYGAKKMTEDQKGNIIGSIYYMAPEQFLRKPVDVRTDLYSLGCVFYQALSCHRPFNDDTVKGVMDAHLQHLVYPLKVVAPEVPQPICDWVMWLLNAEPVHRPANAEAAMQSLKQIIEAGWFNDSTTAAVPVAIPLEERGGWHPTDTVPQVPTSSHPRVASGAVSQRITGTISARQTGAVSQRIGVPAHRTPTRSAPLPVKRTPSAGQKEAEEKSGIPFWVWPTALVLGLVALWALWPKSTPSSATPETAAKTSGAQSAPAQPAGTPSPRPADFIIKDALIHYRAGEKMERWADAAKGPGPAAVNDLVSKWHDLAPVADDNVIAAMDSRKEACPKYVFEKPGDFKKAIGILRFETVSALKHTVPVNDERLRAYPFSPDSPQKGITLLMLVRPNIDKLSGVRLIRMYGPDGTSSLTIRAFPNNDWKVVASVGSDVKEAVAKGRDVKKFNLVGVTWNTSTKKLLINVRSSDGNKTRTEAPAPAATPGVMNEFRIGETKMGSEAVSSGTTEERFVGDLVEFIIWSRPMEWEERTGQEWKIMQDYFTSPGKRY